MNPVEKTTRAGLGIKNFLWDQVCHIESQNSSHASLLAWARRSLNGSLRGARIATEGYKSFKKSKQCPRTQHWHFISLFKTRPSIGRQPNYHTLFIYLRHNSHISSIYDTETPGGGSTPGNSWWRCAAPQIPQILTRFQAKKCNFPHRFSD